jgi:all-trans-retinol 13,14-reductase
MEPITYANGSTLEDPALSYGIVFSNFMSKGVYTFQGGTDRLIGLMDRGAAPQRRRRPHPRDRREDPRRRTAACRAVTVNGRRIKPPGVVSNANLWARSSTSSGRAVLDADFLEQARAVRLNNSSTQVYMALRPGEQSIDERPAATCCSAPPRRRSAPTCC